MKERVIRWKERYVYILLIIFSFVLLFYLIPNQVPEGLSRLIPYVSVAIMLICSIFCLIQCFRKEEVVVTFPKEPFKIFLIGLVIYLVYIYLIEIIGFYIISVVFLFVLLYLLRVRDIKQTLIVTIFIPLAIYLILGLALGLRLPMGFLN